MQTNVTTQQLRNAPASLSLYSSLTQETVAGILADAHLYYSFPIYRGTDDVLVETRLLLLSPCHGIVIFWTVESQPRDPSEAIAQAEKDIDQAYSCIFSRLIRNRALKKDRSSLAFPIHSVIFTPFLEDEQTARDTESESALLTNEHQVQEFITDNRCATISDVVFREIIATLDGSKGLLKPKPRDTANLPLTSKGRLVEQLEAEIALFDQKQKQGYTPVTGGVQRLRGIAGSGKTIVLAMKAALTHIRFPNATIVYTFHTKSLYQLVKRLITRFYRQFEDRDPDWDKSLRILHGWGGASTPGIYSEACATHSARCMSYMEAAAQSFAPFDFACKTLLQGTTIVPKYDYVFIDEGQDFPLSFILLCKALAKGTILAYDELQTIFQTKTPSAAEIFGVDALGNSMGDFDEDIVLYKCYRNPREILVCAHALGFGLYGKKIVQMLENKEHWEDIGYRVQQGDFAKGSATVIERPAESSLPIISQSQTVDEMVQASVHESMEAEVSRVAASIADDISNGLLPDDILVIAVDDRHARDYLYAIAHALSTHEIPTNNIHSDSFGLSDFSMDGRVTLSTVHKAKGNEAYMVYIVGVDAIFAHATVRKRNMLFTAMTRAKGWVRLSGVGDGASQCLKEIETAKRNSPCLRFKYPSEEALKVMRRDLKKAAIEKQGSERIIDELLTYMSPEEIREYLRNQDGDRRSRKSGRKR